MRWPPAQAPGTLWSDRRLATTRQDRVVPGATGAPDHALTFATHWGDSGGTRDGKDGEIRVRTGKFTKQTCRGRGAPTGVLCRGCVENKGVRLAQVGFEPTTLRLTAEPVAVTSRCKHKYLHARKSDYRVNWEDSGGTQSAGSTWPFGRFSNYTTVLLAIYFGQPILADLPGVRIYV